MKNILSLIIICIFCSCSTSNKQKAVKSYYNAHNTGNIELLTNLLGDSVKSYEANILTSKGVNDLINLFKWDVSFEPKYTILRMETYKDSIMVTVSKTCKRIEYLHDEPIVCATSFMLDDDKITRINTYEYQVFDFEKWSQRRDTLVNWSKLHHPELNDFIFDISPEGAQNYLTAIKQFQENHN